LGELEFISKPFETAYPLNSKAQTMPREINATVPFSMLGYIHTATRGRPNAILSDVAARLAAQGVRVTGLVQFRAPQTGAHPCDMELMCLPGGQVFSIAQDLGRGASGCRMDIGSLETAVAQVEREIAQGAEVLIVNKFGAQESKGHGFSAAIAQALDRGVPVITVVNPLNIEAFLRFADGMATELAPEADAIMAWVAQKPAATPPSPTKP
jgi:nucleoside-triphosphatase THEP1